MKYGLTIRRPTTISITRTSKWGLFLLIVAGGLLSENILAQTASDPPHISSVDFVGAVDFSHEVLQNNIRTTANRKFLGIRGFHWWLWLYQLGDAGTLGSRLSRALMNVGEPPSSPDEGLLSADVEQLQIFLQREGYFQSEITPEVHINGAHAHVTFNILQGPATVISHVSYTGLDSLSRAQQLQIAATSHLPPRPNQPLLDYRAIPQRYREGQLIEERRRLLTLLRNMGYAAVTRDSIRAIVTPVTTDSFDVEIRIQAGQRFRYGAVQFEVEGPDRPAPLRIDSLFVEGDSSRLVTSKIQGNRRIKSSLLTNALNIRPGNWYNQSEIQSTKQRLQASGVFSFTDIVSLAPTGQVLPHRITVRTRPRHQFLFSTFIQQSNGALGGVGNELGGGLGLTYKNANMFGSGEVLSLSATGSVAADVDTTFFSSTLAEFSATISLPYLTFPLLRLGSSLDLYQTRTRFTFSYLTARREDLNLIIRGRASARIRFELRHTPNVTSIIDLMDLSLSQPDTLRGFESRFLSRVFNASQNSQIIDPVQRAQILEDYTQPQINNAIRYTFRSEQVNPLRRDDGHSYEANIELGGTLPYILDRFVFTPGTQEQSLRLFSFVGSDSQANYRQYIRFVSSFRRYFRLGTRTVLATKFIGGWAHPIGKATVVPFTHRFYSGGASSVRGWGLRQLGPGAASFNQITKNQRETNLLGGDIKLEASLELRQTMAQDRLGADWIFATFTDAGNVWFGPRNPGFAATSLGQPTGRFIPRNLFKETGIGWGSGVRISWPYLVVRLDLAIRVYDPARPEEGFFPTGLRNWVGYFRLGHTF